METNQKFTQLELLKAFNRVALQIIEIVKCSGIMQKECKYMRRWHRMQTLNVVTGLMSLCFQAQNGMFIECLQN